MFDYFRDVPMKIGTSPQYLFDEYVVEDRWNLKRVVQQPARFTGNPVIVPDQIGEYYCYDNHLILEDGLFRMWYQDSDRDAHYRGKAEPGSAEGHADFCRYAESEDGVHWRKPKLGLLKHMGTAENNIVCAGVNECDRSSVVLSPDPDEKDRRYIMAYLDQPKGKSGFCLAYSPDGLNWTPDPDNPQIMGHYDCVNTVVWDPVRKHWLWYGRPAVHAFGYARLDKGYTDVDWDTGRGRHHRRHVSVSISDDLSNWSKPRVCLYPDELDPEWPDIDTFRPFYRNGVFMANACYVDPTGGRCGSTMLVWSRDGVTWERPHDRVWFLPRGREGDFDDGWVLGSSAPVDVGSQMYFYYGAQQLQMQYGVDRSMSIGLAKLPTDRFVSQRADREPGYLLTREVLVEGRELRVNSTCTSSYFPSLTGMAEMGEIRVELVEAPSAKEVVVGGKPVSGFTMDECDVIRANSNDHLVTWNGKSDLSRLTGQSVHLRFKLTLAELFSFNFYGTP